MRVGSLFTGLGGLDLGLAWAGYEHAWLCDNDTYARHILSRRFPGIPIITDVRDVKRETAAGVDVIAGGFPCTDISLSGKGRGIDYDLSTGKGTRSGLWWEMWRIIRDFRPRYAVIENVPAITHRGLDIVLGGLAEIGYDAEWQTISAAALGAPHLRERIFIVAYVGGREPLLHPGFRGDRHFDEGTIPSWYRGGWDTPWPLSFTRGGAEMEVVEAFGNVLRVDDGLPIRVDTSGSIWPTPVAVSASMQSVDWGSYTGKTLKKLDGRKHQTDLQIAMLMKYGLIDVVPNAMAMVDAENRGVRNRALGNAVVPQIGYLIARAIQERENELCQAKLSTTLPKEYYPRRRARATRLL